MFFRAANLAGLCWGLVAWAALALPVMAQQAIELTKPDEVDPVAKASAYLPSANALGGADSLFDNHSTAFDNFPKGPDPVMPNAAQWQKFLDGRRNWTLMTPEEIMNVPTPESILGITDPHSDPRLSSVERYWQRQDREQAMQTSNSLRRASAWYDESLEGKAFDPTDANRRNLPNEAVSPVGSPSNFSPFFQSAPSALASMKPKVESIWTSPFPNQVQPEKPTPAQLAGMESFRALMAPPSRAKETYTTHSPASSSAESDPNMQPISAFNPNGSSVSALRDQSTRPTGLAPLVGISGPPPAPPKKISLVQPPPWLQDSLQGSSLPNRRF
jgi:hypothetical protein